MNYLNKVELLFIVVIMNNVMNDIVKKIKLFRSSSVVEQSTVNRSVVGSNPTCGAICFHSSVGRVLPW